MKVRRVSVAFVSAALLAALAMSSGPTYANPSEANLVLVRKAYATLQAGDARKAIAEYSDAIASDMLEPEMLANALLNRALANQQLQSHEAALADYDAAIKLNVMAPSLRATAHYNRGLAHQKLAKQGKAIEDFTSALLINPKFSQAYYSRGLVLRDSGQLLFALSDFERALRFGHPDKARVYYGAATTYIALQRPLDAKRELNAALNINPDYGQARAQLVLLGDENARLATADPILTGSVGSFAGGTDVKKAKLPSAIEPPEALQKSFTDNKKIATASPKAKKPFTERLPVADVEAVPETEAQAAAVTVEEVPAIPPAKVKAAVAKAKVVAESESIEDTVAPTAKAVAGPALTGWAVQIASAASEDAAWSTWKKMQASHKVLKEKSPVVVKADLGDKGVFYRVRLGGFDEQSGAKNACAKLKAGGVSCYVSKAGG